jgi:tRNA modification GTPase
MLLTPVGRGAVASLLVAGPGAITAVASAFHPASGRPLEALAPEQIVFGRWESARQGEEVVVCRRDTERIEIHCHGGRVAAERILNSLAKRGCVPTEWPEWIRQSQPDPLRAAALVALASAPTERTASILWDQARGALSEAVDEIRGAISRGDCAAGLDALDQLLSWASLGVHLVRPWRVVLTGPPNAGKSSLLNALLGYGRAIVHDAPGTTRDIVTALTAIDGWPVELADTAGLRVSSDPIEAAGIALAESYLAQADLVVLLRDASLPNRRSDEALAARWPAALRVATKCDLLASSIDKGSDAVELATSAATGAGVAGLAEAMIQRLVPGNPRAAQAMPFLAEQVDQLRLTREAMAAGDACAAVGHLTVLAPPRDGAC